MPAKVNPDSAMSLQVRYANGDVRTLSLGPDDRTATALKRAGLSRHGVGGLSIAVGGKPIDPEPWVSSVYRLPGLAVANNCPSIVLCVEPGEVLKAYFVHRDGGQPGNEGCVTSLIPDAVAMNPIWDAMIAWYRSVINKVFPTEQDLEKLSVPGTQEHGS